MLQFSNSAATVGAVGAVGAVIVFWRLRRRNECWIRVGTVDELCVYPLKGGKAKSVTSAEFGPRGMKAAVFKDRAFAVIRGDTLVLYSNAGRYFGVCAQTVIASFYVEYKSGQFSLRIHQ